eukprot:scaffold10064_cov130-Isochrysis_galbana.AAC.12
MAGAGKRRAGKRCELHTGAQSKALPTCVSTFKSISRAIGSAAAARGSAWLTAGWAAGCVRGQLRARAPLPIHVQ